jgi:hypothetical protein
VTDTSTTTAIGLDVKVNVPDPDNEFMVQDITAEFTLDDEVRVAIIWPHNGEPLDITLAEFLLSLAGQALPGVLTKMEEANRG